MEVHDPPNRTRYVNSLPFGWPHRVNSSRLVLQPVCRNGISVLANDHPGTARLCSALRRQSGAIRATPRQESVRPDSSGKPPLVPGPPEIAERNQGACIPPLPLGPHSVPGVLRGP
jgi:hypothetical protein